MSVNRFFMRYSKEYEGVELALKYEKDDWWARALKPRDDTQNEWKRVSMSRNGISARLVSAIIMEQPIS